MPPADLDERAISVETASSSEKQAYLASGQPLADLEHPWVGLESFREETRAYFFGRDAEISELHLRARGDPLLVLHGRSGLGKTSILLAGLVPKLREEGHWPLLLRLRYGEAVPDVWDQLVSAVFGFADERSGPIQPEPKTSESLLWTQSLGEKLRLPLPEDLASRLWLRLHYLGEPPVITHLVLDQFEEVFTLGALQPGAEVRVRDMLAILLQGAVPEPIGSLISEEDSFGDHFDPDSVPVRVILSLRSDYVYALNRWRRHLPALGQNSFELRALRGPAAFDAVFEPGKLRCHYRGEVNEENRLETGLPPIITQETAQRIVRFVAGKGEDISIEEIEAVPPILSLLCRELNQRRFTGPAGTPETPASQVAFRESEADIETIIAAFYERCLAGRPEAVRIFIEEELVSYSGARLAQDEESILRVFEEGCEVPGAPDDRHATGFGDPAAARACLEQLVNQRLLSSVGGSGTPSYELVHDLLAAVVERSRTSREERLEKEKADRRVEAERQAKEDAEASARQAAEHAAILDKALKEETQARREADRATRRARRLAVAISLVAVLAVVGFGTAVIGGMIARQERQRAAERRAQADAYFQIHQATLQTDRGELRPALALLEQAFSAHPDFTTRSAFLSALSNAPNQLETSFTGFEGAVQELQFGPDDVLAAAAGGSVRLLDTKGLSASGPAFTPESEEAPTILCITRRQDGNWLAQREDGTVLILKEGQSAAQLLGGNSPMRIAKASGDGRRLAFVSARRRNEVAIGSFDEFGKTEPIEPIAEEVTALEFGPGGALAVGTAGGGIFLISPAGEKQHLREATQASVRCLAWRDKGEPLLAAGDENGNIELLKGETPTHRLANVPAGVQDLEWSPDGRSLAAACTDGTVRIWAVSEALDEEPQVLTAHKGPVLSVAWSPDGGCLASGGNDGTVCIWRPSAAFGPVITHSKGVPLYSLSVSEDGARIAAGSERGDIFVWDAGTNTNSTIWTTGSRVRCLAWQPARERLASGNESGEIQIWQPSTRDAVRSVRPGESKAENDQTVWRVRWSHDGKKLASSSHTGAVQIWKPDGNAPPRLVGKLPDYALGLAWSQDDTMLAAGSTTGEIWIWRAADGGEPVVKISGEPGQGHADSVASLVFLPGGNVLASCGRDGTLRLWDTRSGAALAVTPPVAGFLDDLAHSNDGSKISAVGTDGYLRVWESNGLVPSFAIPMHHGPIAAVAWKGERVFSASDDGTVRILDLDETKWKARARQIIGVEVRKRARPQSP